MKRPEEVVGNELRNAFNEYIRLKKGMIDLGYSVRHPWKTYDYPNVYARPGPDTDRLEIEKTVSRTFKY